MVEQVQDLNAKVQLNIEEFRRVFELYDRDGNGAIDLWELQHVMECLGEEPTAAELQAMIQAVDENQNGTIEFDEFLKLMMTDLKASNPSV
ncbi:MAG: EF-hand domain-containing protein [Cyanobacteria bacterium P01_G01_bin.54]